jgi:hypothetical protein
VLELDDLEDGAVDLDVVAVLELVGRDDGGSASFAGKTDVHGFTRNPRC